MAAPNATYTLSEEEQDDLDRRFVYHCMNGDLQDAVLALAEGANVDAVNGHGWSALHLSIANSHEDIARVLIENGADVNVLDNSGMSPLFLAAMLEKLDILQPLLEAGAHAKNVLDDSHQLQGQVGDAPRNVIRAWAEIKNLDKEEASSHALMGVFNRLSQREKDALDIGDLLSRSHSRMLKSIRRQPKPSR